MLAADVPLAAQLLKLGHHGSRTSSSLDFLLAVKPDVAIFSAELGGAFGHPHAEVIDRLRMLGIRVFGTDRYGTILVTTDGQNYQFETVKAGFPEPAVPSGMVDLNNASWEELQNIVHIGPERATAIINWRAQ